MNGQKNILDIIKNLSPEEREMHRELIAECCTRESDVERCGTIIRENVNRLVILSEKMSEDMGKLIRVSRQLEKEVKTYEDRTMNDYLQALPSERFFNA